MAAKKHSSVTSKTLNKRNQLLPMIWISVQTLESCLFLCQSHNSRIFLYLIHCRFALTGRLKFVFWSHILALVTRYKAAYEEMLYQQPILANGNQMVQDYFSLSALKQKLGQQMGIDWFVTTLTLLFSKDSCLNVVEWMRVVRARWNTLLSLPGQWQ